MLSHQLSQANDALHTAREQLKALQLEAREARQQRAQAAEQLTALEAQLSASNLPSASDPQSPGGEEVQEMIATALRGELLLQVAQFRGMRYIRRFLCGKESTSILSGYSSFHSILLCGILDELH